MGKTYWWARICNVILSLLFFDISIANAQPEPEGTIERRTIEFDGRERTYLIYLPQNVAPAPWLTFVMHGSGSKPEMIRQGMSFEFDLLADQEGSIVVYPNGFEDHWHDCRADLPYSAHSEGVDDVGFLLALRESLISEYEVDANNVYAVGMSNGGHMAYRLAHEAPQAFQAFAVVAASLPSDSNFDCQRSNSAASVLVITGTEDPINPYEGGMVTMFDQGERGEVLSAQASAEYWAELAAHVDEPQTISYPDVREDDESTASALVWSSEGKPTIKLITIEGGGHAVPHPSTKFPPFFGATNADINGPQEVWSFFRERKD